MYKIFTNADDKKNIRKKINPLLEKVIYELQTRSGGFFVNDKLLEISTCKELKAVGWFAVLIAYNDSHRL
jgi:hypothetical protein